MTKESSRHITTLLFVHKLSWERIFVFLRFILIVILYRVDFMPTVSEIITQFTISCSGKKCCYCVSDLLSIKFLSFVICSIVNQQEFQLAKLLVFKLKKGLIFYKNHYI